MDDGRGVTMQGAADQTAIARSASLDESLQRAHRMAVAQNHGVVTLEHLLFALSEDGDAVALMAASRADMDRLRTDVSGYLGRMTDAAVAIPGQAPVPGADLLRILQLAGLAARQSQRKQIDSAIVLAAIIGDGNSPAAGMLKAQGLTFEEVIRVLQQGLVAKPAEPALPPPSLQPQVPTPSAKAQTAEEYLASARARVKQAEPPRTAPTRPLPHVDPRPAPQVDTRPAPQVETQSAPVIPPSPTRGGQPPPLPMAPPPLASSASPPLSSSASPPLSSSASPQATAGLATFRPGLGGGPGSTPPPTPMPPSSLTVEATPVPPPPPAAPQPASARPPMQLAPPAFPPTQPYPVTPPAPYPAAPPQPYPPTPAPSPYQMAPPPSAYPPSQPPPAAPPRALPGAMPPLLPRQPVDIVAAAAGLPALMRISEPVLIEVRVPRGELDVPRATARPGVASLGDAPVYRVVTARLTAAGGAIGVEARTPETVWLEPTLQPVADDVVWQFLATPTKRGTIPVTLTISGRTISAYGVMADQTAPTETFAVTVKRPRGALFKRFVKGVVLMAVGAGAAWVVLGPLAPVIRRVVVGLMG